jgi:hypothetical protein
LRWGGFSLCAEVRCGGGFLLTAAAFFLIIDKTLIVL